MRWILGLAVAVCALATAGGAGSAPGHSPFRPGPCPFAFDTDLEVDCGTLSVPENRDRWNSRTITLQVAIVRAATSHPRADPILYQNGGPSFPSVVPWAMEYFDGADFAADRDVILVDQRGEGSSVPRLTCPELNGADEESFYAKPLIGTGDLERYSDAIRACRDRWTSAGVDLSGYNNEEVVADFETLRKALGIKQWNLFAVSADGVAGMTYLRLASDGLRTAVIDSGQTNTTDLGLDYLRGYVEQLDRILAGCAANTACRATYPNLRSRLYRTVADLNAHPVVVRVKVGNKTIRVRIDGGWLLHDIAGGAVIGNIQETFQAIWQATHDGIEELYQGWFGTDPPEFHDYDDGVFTSAYGNTISYRCHDLLAFETKADFDRAAADLPELASFIRDPFFDGPYGKAACKAWDNGVAEPAQHQPFRSKVPALIGIGELDGDGGVPPLITRQAKQSLPNSFEYTFPATGHVTFASYSDTASCARAIAEQFMASPTRRPSSSCMASLPQYDYTP